MSISRFLGRRRSPDSPPQSKGWVGAAYGHRAQSIVENLADRLQAAEEEATVARGSASDEIPAGHSRERTRLELDLTELRTLILGTTVPPVNEQRDLRLRASLSVAIGAASSLAMASPSQPTLAYLRVTQAAVEDVLVAAEQRVARAPRREKG